MYSKAAPTLVGLAIGVGFVVLFSAIFTPSHRSEPISKEKAVETAVSDLTTKYIRNPVGIKIYAIVGNQTAAYLTVDSFLKERNINLVRVHSEPNGTFYSIDPRTDSLEECHLPYCPLPEEGMRIVGGRIAWIVDLVAKCENFTNNTTGVIYAIDAESGKIIFYYGSPQPEKAYVCS